MTITSLFGLESDDPKLKLFHDTRGNPKKVICTKDNPRSRSIEHHIFKKGDIVVVNGTVGEGDNFMVSIPEVCGFYDYTHFELVDDEEIKLCESHSTCCYPLDSGEICLPSKGCFTKGI